MSRPRLGQHPGRDPGTRSDRPLFDAVVLPTPTESELEDATHDLILARFQPPQVQPTLILDGIPARPDFRWPAEHLTVEADGAQFHDTLIARQDDAAKQARLEAHGDRVVRVTWDQVMTQPEQTVTRIRTAGAPRRAG